MVGVTQAAVSQYLSSGRMSYVSKLKRLGLGEEEVERYIGLICEDLLVSPVEAIQTLYAVWKDLLAKGILCAAHQSLSPIPRECDVCMRVFASVKQDDKQNLVLKQMEKALSLLASSPDFQAIMPEVSVNLVMCPEDARKEGAVAAIPGRIVKVYGRARAMMPPQFGASHHMARMLLAARSLNPTVQACINTKFDANVKVILSGMGLSVLFTVDKDRLSMKPPDVVVEAFSEALQDRREPFRVVVDRGGPGLEPMTYLFGGDAVEVCQTALELASRYRGR